MSSFVNLHFVDIFDLNFKFNFFKKIKVFFTFELGIKY